MDGMPLFYVMVFGLLMLLAHVAGAAMANLAFRGTMGFHSEIRDERELLRQSNRQLEEDVFKLRQEVLDLRAQLAAALEQIARLSSLKTDEEGVID